MSILTISAVVFSNICYNSLCGYVDNAVARRKKVPRLRKTAGVHNIKTVFIGAVTLVRVTVKGDFCSFLLGLVDKHFKTVLDA